jgi:protein transport protein SEC20
MPKYRQHKDKEGLVKVSSDVTEKLLSISRHLADTTQRSAGTLETLGMAVTVFYI